MLKTIETHMSRKFTVRNSGFIGNVNIEVENTHSGEEIASNLRLEDAVDLGKAILEAAGKKAFLIEGSLPGVGTDGHYYVTSQDGGNQSRSIDTPSESLMRQIKGLIAIHAKAVQREEEEKTEAFQKAEAKRKLDERRDELTNRFNDSGTRTYLFASQTLKNAVDAYIELEDKLKVDTKG